ncbi:MAG TPA: response regulator [Thermoanaerobaculia bacterium]|nr:response regulator [Thermoanaerobaculia bacterium]
MTHRILVVDDADTIRFAFGRHLRSCGFEVDCARELEEAEALALHTDYALVIADLSLTGIDGREGLEMIRFLRRHRPAVRVIVITANGSPAAEEEAYARGAHAFVDKCSPLADIARLAGDLARRAS